MGKRARERERQQTEAKQDKSVIQTIKENSTVVWNHQLFRTKCKFIFDPAAHQP